MLQRRWTARERRNLYLGLGFLAPNILGFLAFTLIPLVFSFAMAFSNWDLRLHNMFKEEGLDLVGLGNFIRLLQEDDFQRYLGNTLFLMMAIPFSIAASLFTAMLLSKDLRGGSRTVFLALVAGALLIGSTLVLVAIGGGSTGFTILLCGLAGGILMTGTLGGTTVYRTLFYMPHFTAGVATYLLWKKLYNPHTGPINTFLGPMLDSLAGVVQGIPPELMRAGLWTCLALVVLIIFRGLRRMRLMWTDGELGTAAALLPIFFLLLPVLLAPAWMPAGVAGSGLIGAGGAALAWQLSQLRRGRNLSCSPGEGLGSALMFALVLMVGEFVLLGLGIVAYGLPEMAGDGLVPPEWLANYYWAKPALMLMGFWVALGSNNMLLYLAGLSNVPQELYEAADMDGASRFQRFWYVTWPQLAPTTFFIVVMSVIGGLQGGFEMAYTMTRGGPAGSTTTLSYFIFTEGFETGRLGYSSAVAWTMFVMIFLVTLFNWRFGSRYVND